MRIFWAAVVGLKLFGLVVPVAQAANGSWINPAGGSWTNAANWSGGIIANGSGSTANFNTLNLPADATVTLDGSRTIGSFEFADQNPIKHTWNLNPGSGGVLTLSASPATFTVSSGTARVNVVLAGTAGFTKTGTGRLVLGATNTYTGTTFIDAGILGLQQSTFSANNTLVIVQPDGLVESAGRLSLAVNTIGTAIVISGAGALRLTSTNSSAVAPDLDFGPNHVNNTCYGARLATRLELGNSQRFVFGRTGHNGVGPYGLTGADCQFAGPISGSGGLTFIAQNEWTSTGPMGVSIALSGRTAMP